jgi:predicted nucleotidyltransferase component of viral defense system
VALSSWVDQGRVSERSLADDEAKIYEARVYFKSFYGEEDVRIRVDLDVKEFDRLFLPLQSRRLIHAYSDSVQCQADIRCVKLEELLASKLKALLQRQRLVDLKSVSAKPGETPNSVSWLSIVYLDEAKPSN